MTDEILLKRFAEKIKLIRVQRGLSQQELAALLDYEKSNMSRLESGKVNLRLTTIYAVAKALDIPLSELLNIE